MHPIMAVIEILVIVAGLFFLAAAATEGKYLPRMAGSTEGARRRHARGPATLLPRTIRRTALD